MHPNYLYLPGIEASTGSLGHGLSISLGMSVAGKVDKKNYRVFCMTGDGEMHEGSIWEALMAAGHFGMGNLTLIIDYNKFSGSGPIDKVMDIEPLADKLKSFKWNVVSIDGHNMSEVAEALNSLPPVDSGKPNAIISNTKKGYLMPEEMKMFAGGHIAFIPTEEALNGILGIIDNSRKGA